LGVFSAFDSHKEFFFFIFKKIIRKNPKVIKNEIFSKKFTSIYSYHQDPLKSKKILYKSGRSDLTTISDRIIFNLLIKKNLLNFKIFL